MTELEIITEASKLLPKGVPSPSFQPDGHGEWATLRTKHWPTAIAADLVTTMHLACITNQRIEEDTFGMGIIWNAVIQYLEKNLIHEKPEAPPLFTQYDPAL